MWGPKHVRHCLPGCASVGSWNWNQSWNLKPETLIWDAGIPTAILMTMPNAHPGKCWLMGTKIELDGAEKFWCSIFNQDDYT